MERTGFNVSKNQATQTKKFNTGLRLVQGYRNVVIGQASTTITITLNSAAKFLLGISIFPITGNITDLADTQIKFIVNNRNLLLNMGANNLNPNFVQNMMFFPTPQPLVGTDSISLEVSKNNAVDATILTNIFYVPRV